MKGVMESAAAIVGVIFVVLGVVCVFGAVLRALGEFWRVSRYEMWVLLGVGLGLLFTGTSLIE